MAHPWLVDSSRGHILSVTVSQVPAPDDNESVLNLKFATVQELTHMLCHIVFNGVVAKGGLTHGCAMLGFLNRE